MKKITALFLALLMLFSLAACGSSAAKSSSTAYMPEPAAQYAGSYAAADSAYETAYPMEAPAAAREESAAGGLSNTAHSDTGSNSQAAPSAGEIAVDKIIYSASATVETTDFDDSLAKLEALIAQYGGFVESSSISGNNYYRSSRGYASQRSAEYRIRIPSRDFGTVMNSLSTLGNVPYSNTYSENITSQYYDVQARLEACRTQEQSLLEMMAKADKVSDMLEIQDQLSEVRYRIESLQSTLTNWDRQVSYSTISLSLQEVQEYTPESKVSYGEQLRLALSRGLKSVGEFFRNLLLWLLEALPTLIVLAALVLFIVFLVRRISRRARVRREKRAAAAAQARAAQAQAASEQRASEQK
ncbi:MAG: DUF4349 domain-containing protein, partial [Oscillospiraceae bacterium]|nr:DUF4349 domain-containing protein [Oscillospiraceae bacterium]